MLQDEPVGDEKETGQKKARKHIDIPTPVIGTVDTYEAEHNYTFAPTPSYFRYKKDTKKDFEVSKLF